MSSFFAKHRVADPDHSEEGVWIYGAYHGYLDIKIRRANSNKAQETLRRLYKPFRAMRTIPQDKRDEIDRQWVAEGILIDWRQSETADDEPPEYSVQTAMQAFHDDPDFLDEVVGFAQEAETFRAERLEEDSKNSQTSSTGSSSGGSGKKNSQSD